MYSTQLCSPRYAVIEARWNGRPAERCAIAYDNEESLRDLLASSSIIGSGFISQQEALALIPGSTAVAPTAACATDAVRKSEDTTTSVHPLTGEWDNPLISQRIWTIPTHLLNQMAAAFIVILCSKNVFSMAFRAFMGV